MTLLARALLISSFLGILGSPTPRSASAVGPDASYPIKATNGEYYATSGLDGDGWKNDQDFLKFNDPRQKFHLGEDWNGEGGQDSDCFANNPTVNRAYAAADGQVVFAQPAGTGWSNVVIVRHSPPGGTAFETLYGHLNHIEADVFVGASVAKNQFIGGIGKDEPAAACTDADKYAHCCHLHFELRLDSSSSWGTPGLGYVSAAGQASGWLDPSDFIDGVGYYVDGWHGDGSSQAIITSYQSSKALIGKAPTPDPSTPGSEFVHPWSGSLLNVLLQDFHDDDWSLDAVIMYDSTTGFANAIRSGFWLHYWSQGGPGLFGTPTADEKEVQSIECGPNTYVVYQRFTQGTMAWDGDPSHGVEWHANGSATECEGEAFVIAIAPENGNDTFELSLQYATGSEVRFSINSTLPNQYDWVTLYRDGQPVWTQSGDLSTISDRSVTPENDYVYELEGGYTQSGPVRRSPSIAVTIAAATGSLGVQPASGFSVSGPYGGPFTPSAQNYTLTNSGSASLTFSVAESLVWLDATPTNGSLAPGASSVVSLSMTSSASTLSAGSYVGSVSFINATNGSGNTNRLVSLVVDQPIIGSIRVSILPQEAVSSAGAQWRIAGQQQWNNSGAIVPTPTGTHTIVFKDVPFWIAPPDLELTLYSQNPDIWIDSEPYTPVPPPDPPGDPVAVEWSEIPFNELFDAWPPRLQNHAMVYDAGRQRLVLFGGYGWNLPGDGLSNQTWEYDGSSWIHRQPAHAPLARRDHAMAYDAANGVVLLFGGRDENFVKLNDMWAWDGNDWTQLFPSTSPTPRTGAGMAYFPELGSVVLDGGNPGGTPPAETWHWTGSNWTPGTAFIRSYDHGMTYDPVLQRVLKYYSTGSFTYFTSSYNGFVWENFDDAPNPMECGIDSPAFSYSHLRLRTVLHAAWFFCPQETWEFDGASWAQLVTVNIPPGRDDTAMADAPELGGTYLYGGQGGGSDPQRDFWVLSRPPVIDLSESSISRSIEQGQNASSQTLDVWNSGGGALSYSIMDDAGWLAVTPSTGVAVSEVDTLTLTYATSALPPGNYNATIQVDSALASNTPQVVAVGLTVDPPADQDGDGLADTDEATFGTNPANPDTDGDGLNDGSEVQLYATDPLAADTDGDGFNDGAEISAGSDPNDPNSPSVTNLPALSPPFVGVLILGLLAAAHGHLRSRGSRAIELK